MELWVHDFVHTLGTLPKAWYVKEEVQRQIGHCEFLES